MTTKLHPKTVQTRATIKKVKSLILKENPQTEISIATKLGMCSGTKDSETGIKCILCNEIRVKSPYTSPMDFCAFDLLKRAIGKWHPNGVIRSLPTNYYGHLALTDKRCGNSSPFINSWEGISELGPRRHKETQQQCVLFAPDPVTTAHLETHNVYPDIGAHGARAGRRRNRWDRLRDNSSKSRVR
ncbi:hypothetical protein TNCV_510571 [Trichonephila clavipes]|nr:hypothetical protein TNCV_510571 [Trichonephila clavipes]